MCIISEFCSRFDPQLLPRPKYRILYAGNDLALLKSLKDALENCLVVRCPDGGTARALIKSLIEYSLVLSDERLPGASGAELEEFARLLAHRKETPVIIHGAGDSRGLVEAIRSLLDV